MPGYLTFIIIFLSKRELARQNERPQISEVLKVFIQSLN